MTVPSALHTGADTDGVELTQYSRGEGRGLGLQLMLPDGSYTYLSPAAALSLGGRLVAWGHDVTNAQGRG